MGRIEPDMSVFRQMQKQPEFNEQIWQYINRRVSDWRIINGREALKKNEAVFARIEQDFGVERGTLLALWGVESAYGDPLVQQNHMTPVFPSLAALAWNEPRRKAYWETELINALKIVDRGWSTPEEMRGSWAGAMGHTQWMPEVWLNVGFDRVREEDRWPSRFQESQPSTGPRGTGCWSRKSGCAVLWKRWLPPGAGLPLGGVVPQDYVFHGQGPDGAVAEVRLSELFAPGRDSLVVYSMMFPRDSEDDRPGPPGGQTALLPLAQSPCPSCTALLDALDGAAEHASQRVNLAAAGKAPIERILTFAAERRSRHLRLLSSAGTTYNRDYLAETSDGEQQPMLNVFRRDGDTIRHFWGSELFYAPFDAGQGPRHVGTLETLWNLFDLTPEDAELTGMSSWTTELYVITGNKSAARPGLYRTAVPGHQTTRSRRLSRAVLSPSFPQAPNPGERIPCLGSAEPIACDATAGSDLDAVAGERDNGWPGRRGG